MEAWQRKLDEMIDQALFGGQAFTSTSAAAGCGSTLTLDGMLYHLAVIQQDFEENPAAVAMRAEPGTIALLERMLPKETATLPVRFDGMRIEEKAELPPRHIEFIDYRGRVLRHIVIE